MDHPLTEHRLPGIGPLRQARLAEAGIEALEQLVALPPAELQAIPGFTAAIVERCLAAAHDVLQRDSEPGAEIIELDDPTRSVPPPAEPSHPPDRSSASSKALRRGLTLARRIEESLDLLRRIQARAEDAPSRFRHRGERLERQRRKLQKVVSRIQREAITHGLSKAAVEDLGTLLHEIDRSCEKFLARSPSDKRMKKLQRRLKSVRADLRERIT